MINDMNMIIIISSSTNMDMNINNIIIDGILIDINEDR